MANANVAQVGTEEPLLKDTLNYMKDTCLDPVCIIIIIIFRVKHASVHYNMALLFPQ